MTIDNVTVCGHRILLDPEYPEQFTESGLCLATPETYKREQAATTEGRIVAIGPMAWKSFDSDHPDWKPWAKEGDKVIFAKYAGRFIKVKDKDYIIINDDDIHAIIEE